MDDRQLSHPKQLKEDYTTSDRDLEIAVLIPCLNEEQAIAGVVDDFRRAIPSATIYVYDNGSTDQTISIARAEGAVVRQEPRRGKASAECSLTSTPMCT